jgi:DNA-binding SARP family transcriptional activator/WD40 repeat protein
MAMAEVCVLGPLLVRDGDAPVHVGGPRQRRLLATLLIHHGLAVSVSALVDGVFGSSPPRRAEATLRTYVTRLRRVLPDGIDVIAEPPGYALRTAAPDAIDAVRFDSERARGQQLLAHGERETAVRAFTEALQLWRGRPFEEVADEPWAAPEVRRLEAARTACRVGLVDALVADDRATDALPIVRELVAAEPFDENLRLRQARTFYRAGQANDALAALREFRGQLAEELGLDPSPELDVLEQAILHHDPGLGSARRVRGYLIGERLGRGASGPVHAAWRAASSTRFAIRIYPSALADDPSFVRSFIDDVRRLDARSHPAFVPIYDAWREPGVAYLVMGRLTGGTLTDRLRRGPLSADELTVLQERIVGAVAAARESGVRHGRLSTDAVLYGADGLPYLTDLALGEAALRDGDDKTDLTTVLTTVGASERVVSPPVRRNPYVGLEPFDTKDAAHFYGRERLVDELAARVTSDAAVQRFTLLVGPSGSGKSSVVRAGLVPRMRASTVGPDPWLVAVTRPTATPVKELAESLRRVGTRAASSVLDDLADGQTTLADAVAALVGSDARLLLVVEQLEALFALADDQTTAYLTSLTETVRTEARFSVVATLRADHYDRPLRLPDVGALIQHATVIVPPLGDEERRRAIIEPAHDAGLTVDDEVLRRLLAESRDSLPALQYTLFELAERADGRLSAADLADLGGLEGAIAHRAEQLAAALGEDAERASTRLRALFRHLVGLDQRGDPARRRAPLHEVLAEPDALDRETVQSWVDARLLTTDRDAQTREPVVQISHEALLSAWPRLHAWIDEERDWLRLASQARTAAGEWEALGRDDDALWRGARLDRADDVLGAHRTGLPEQVATFLARSLQVRAAEQQAAVEQEQEKARSERRIRRQRSWLAAALVVVVTVAAVAWQQRQDALDSAQRAEDRARAATLGLVTAADEARAEDWTRSLLLAVEARRLDDSPRTQEALLATLSDPSPIPTDLRVQRTALAALGVDPDSGAIVAKDTVGVVTVLAPDGSVQHPALATPPSFHRGGLAVKGGLVLSAGVAEDGVGVVVHDIGEGSRLGSLDTNPGEIPDVAFDPDGVQFAVTGNGRVRIVDVASLRVVRSLRHPEPVALISVHWAADGTRLYAGGTEGEVATWDLSDASAEPFATTVAADVPTPIVDLDQLADGDLLVAATFDTGTLLLHPDDLRVVAGPLGADNAVMGVSVDESGAELAVAASSRVDRWQVFPGRAPLALEPVGGGATAAYRGLDELVTGGLDGSVTAWQLRPDVPGLISLDELGAGNPRLDPTGRVLAMWGFGAGVRMFDAGTLQPVSTLPFDDPEHTSFSGVAFNSDGSRIAAVWCTGPSHVFAEPCDGWVGVYDVATGDRVAAPTPSAQLAPWVGSAIAWSSDGAWLATGHIDGSVEIRHAGDLRLETTLFDLAASGDGFVTEVDFTDASASQPLLVATVGTDAATWSVPAWERLGRSRVGVTAHFAPDGRVLTSDQDGTVRLRDAQLSVLDTYRGLPLPVIRPRFSADGARFVTIDDFTGETRIWRTDPLAPIGGPVGVAGRASGVTLSPDGTRLLVGGDRVWELRLDPDRWEEQACLAAGRNLTQEEWRTHLGDEPYRRTCPQFSAGD